MSDTWSLSAPDNPSPTDPNSPQEQAARPPAEDAAAQLLTFKAWFRADAAHSEKWRKEAKEDFDFLAGDQWLIEDQQALKAQGRPIITFNRSATIISAVAGMEINGRHEVSFIPRGSEDTAVNEILTGASKWMADECDGEDEESDAFQKMLTCGMGWVEHFMEHVDDPSGKYVESSMDPLEMYWDRAARKKNLADARRLWRVRRMPLGDALGLFPDKSPEQLDAGWAHAEAPTEPIKTLEERRIRDDNGTGGRNEVTEVTIVQCQWWEIETYYLVADPQTGTKTQLSEGDYLKLKARMADLERKLGVAFPLLAVPMKRKCYKRAFIGNEILEVGKNPIPDRFTWTCVTGAPNHNKRTWYGLIRMLRDPQMWANKWLSQVLHILNATAKGGIIAETDAFEDQRQAEEMYNKPEGIAWAARGSISNGPGQQKIMEKPGRGDPSKYVELLSFAVSATRDVSGINLELLGQKDVNQPGVLEAQRKQAGMTVLATMFDALRRMRKQVGRIRLYMIQNFLSDGRIIRITGPQGAKAVRLLRDQCLGEYDTIVDDTPTSPNQKQANWAIIMSLLGVFGDYLKAKPELLPVILEYSPLPSALTDAIKQAMAAPDPEQQKQQALAIAAQVAKIMKDQSQAELFASQAKTTEATAVYDVAMAQNLLTKNNGQLDSIREALEAQHKAAQTETERAKADQIRAQTAGQQADTAATQVDSAVKAITPIPHSDPVTGGPVERPPVPKSKGK